MRINVKTDELRNAINAVIPALSIKAETIGTRAYEFICITVEGSSMELKCCNLNIQISTEIAVESDGDGKMLLPGKLISDVIRTLPESETVLEQVGNAIQLSSGALNMMLQTIPADEFTGIRVSYDKPSIRIQQGLLKRMITQTAPFTLQDNTRPILEGVSIELEGNELTMVALDALKLAKRCETVENVSGEDIRIIVPGRLIESAARVLSDVQDTAELNFLKQNLMIKTGELCIIMRTIQGEFVKYRNMLPQSYQTRAFVNRKELVTIVERAYLVAREEKNNVIRFEFKSDSLTISVNNEIGKVTDKMSIIASGEELLIAFNAKYALDILKSLDDDEVCIELQSALAPCVIKPSGGESYYYLILPIRLA